MIKDYFELTKPRITVFILICTAVGYYFASKSDFDLLKFCHALLGTGLMASGTAALNQWYERDVDARMRRTRKRPIPSGRVTPTCSFVFATILSISGFVELWFGTTVPAAYFGLLTETVYLFLYTPLKRLSPICTTIGAIPGALPPIIGYSAAGGGLTASALALFGILFLWQFPHFYSIAWVYREDYAGAGIRMLPVIKSDGHSTAVRIVACSIALLFVSLAPHFLGMAGAAYAAVATLLGLALTYFGVRVATERTAAAAHNLLLASVLYLPALLTIMIVDSR